MKRLLLSTFVLLLVGCSKQQFDSEKWKNWKETETTMPIRWNMFKSLTKEHELVGMKYDEIIDLLGDPSSESANSMEYNLGVAGHGVNHGWLQLSLNKNYIVTDYKVSKH